MVRNSHKYFLVIALTLVVAVIIFRVHNAESIKNNKIFSFPFLVGEWSGKEVVMENWVFESLETPYAILRDYYSQKGEKVNLAIVWFDDKNIAFHAPEACLGGVGNMVKEKSVETLKLGGGNISQIGRLLAESRSGNRNLVFYYFVTDGFMTPNQTELREEVLFKRIKFKRTSAAFVRLMTPIKNTKKEAKLVLEDFLKAIVHLVQEYTDTEKVQSGL